MKEVTKTPERTGMQHHSEIVTVIASSDDVVQRKVSIDGHDRIDASDALQIIRILVNYTMIQTIYLKTKLILEQMLMI